MCAPGPPSRNSCFSSRAKAAVSSSSVLPASRVASRIWRPYTSTVPAVVGQARRLEARPEVQLRHSVWRHGEVHLGRALGALVSREAAVQWVVDVVGLGHVHHEVGGRAEPVAAGEEELSAGRQVVGAHNVPRVRRQGQSVAGRYLRAHLRGSVDDREQGVRCQGAGVRLGGLQPAMEASRLTSSEASAAAVTAPRRALATLVSTPSGVILAAMSREWLARRCWPRRWSRSWPPWCCSLTASGPRRQGCSSWPPRPPGRRRPTGLPCWRDPWSASSAARRCCFRGHLSVRGGQGRRRGQGASALLSSFDCGWLPRCCRRLPCSRPGPLLARKRAVSYLSVVQDLRDVAGDRSFKHVYICFRQWLRRRPRSKLGTGLSALATGLSGAILRWPQD